MSYYKDFDSEYQVKKTCDPNYNDPKWCAIEELEKRIEKLENQELHPKNSEAWKKDPATDIQKGYMVSKSIPFKGSISKGEAAEKIARYIEAQKKAR